MNAVIKEPRVEALMEVEPQPEKQPQILFVDDERPILNSLNRLFRPTGFKIHLANSGDDRTSNVFRSRVRGNTDRFMLRFDPAK